MSKTDLVKQKAQRAKRSRAKVFGTADRPRLSVHISNLQVSAQLIDDETSKTLASATSLGDKKAKNLSEKANLVGQAIAEQASKVKIRKVVFDRGAKAYHGRVKALADAAREKGLEF